MPNSTCSTRAAARGLADSGRLLHRAGRFLLRTHASWLSLETFDYFVPTARSRTNVLSCPNKNTDGNWIMVTTAARVGYYCLWAMPTDQDTLGYW